nr:retrovirus-related Pol polyprotein from transposon TNT 1-94 [Tanacetum cinerariifolium]
MGNRGSDLYIIALEESSSPTLLFFMAKAFPTQTWLWHPILSYLAFDTINQSSKNDIVNGLPKLKYSKDQLWSSCELGKSKRSTFKTKIVPSSKARLHLLHMDLSGLMLVDVSLFVVKPKLTQKGRFQPERLARALVYLD